MGIKDLKDQLLDSLNPSIFSLSSLPGIIILILIIMLIYSFYKHATKAIGWFGGILIVYEAFYCLSLTGFNDIIPLSYVFKHDILVSISQLFVGTPICDGLLYIAAFIGALMAKLWSICSWMFGGITYGIEFIFDIIKESWHAFWTHEGR